MSVVLIADEVVDEDFDEDNDDYDDDKVQCACHGSPNNLHHVLPKPLQSWSEKFQLDHGRMSGRNLFLGMLPNASRQCGY